MMGFSTNTLSLLGLVLAVGLVVDDAIVVVEAIEAKIEHGLSPRDAALQAMDEVSGALVGIALVLSSVFVPAAFIAGITGSLYRQFALTIAFSVLISAFNALTLSPALGALILRPRSKHARRGLLGRFFNGFDRAFATTQTGYIEDNKFTRIREVTGTYNFSPSFTKKYIRATGGSFTFGVRNVALFSDWTGVDPEQNYGQGDTQQTLLTAGPPRYYTARLNLSF